VVEQESILASKKTLSTTSRFAMISSSSLQRGTLTSLTSSLTKAVAKAAVVKTLVVCKILMMECACLVQLWVRYGPSLFTCVATSNSPLDVSTTFRAAEDAFPKEVTDGQVWRGTNFALRQTLTTFVFGVESIDKTECPCDQTCIAAKTCKGFKGILISILDTLKFAAELVSSNLTNNKVREL
jgi:hypothetical protein